MKNQIKYQPKFIKSSSQNKNLNKKLGQSFVDFFLFFIIILLVLNLFLVFVFFTSKSKYNWAENYKYFSLTLQASEDLYFNFGQEKDNQLSFGVIEEEKIPQDIEQYKNFNIFYSFNKPEDNPFNDFKNQLCLKRFMYSNTSNSTYVFWVCSKWGEIN